MPRSLRRTTLALAVAAGAVAMPGAAAAPGVEGVVVVAQGNLGLVAFGSHTVRPVTPPRARGEQRTDTAAVLSPDASRIAFVRHSPRHRGVYLVGADGQRLRVVQLLEPTEDVSSIAWSPDGAAIVFAVNGFKPAYVELAQVDLRERLVLWAAPENRRAGVVVHGWSPDGTRVLFTASYGEELWFDYTGPDVLMVSDLRGATVALARTLSVGAAAWSPDGGTIAYTGNCYSLCQLYAVSPSGGASRPVTAFAHRTSAFAGGYDSLSFAWKPSSSSLYYALHRDLYERDVAAGTSRRVATVPCPPRGCLGPIASIRAVSADGTAAIVTLDDVVEIQTPASARDVSATYAVSLVGGGTVKVAPLPAGTSDIRLG